MSNGRGAPAWIMTTARDLYLVAMAVFVVNIVIGILNGADAVEFDRNQILTHVHAGTVGWLTLTIVASTFLLFQARRSAADAGSRDPRPDLRPRLLHRQLRVPSDRRRGAAHRDRLAAVVAVAAYLAGERTLPRLAVVLGLTTFGYGALIGVLIQVELRRRGHAVPGDTIGAHASAMTFGYLVLVAMGFIEWRVLGTRDMPRLGLVQVGALFLGGLIISVSLLVGAEQAGGGIYLLTQLIAVVAVRRSASGRDRCGSTGPRRTRSATSRRRRSGWWPRSAMFMYVVFVVISTGIDPTAPAPPPSRRPDRQRSRGLHRDRHEHRARPAHHARVAAERAPRLDRAADLPRREPRSAGVRHRADRRTPPSSSASAHHSWASRCCSPWRCSPTPRFVSRWRHRKRNSRRPDMERRRRAKLVAAGRPSGGAGLAVMCGAPTGARGSIRAVHGPIRGWLLAARWRPRVRSSGGDLSCAARVRCAWVR